MRWAFQPLGNNRYAVFNYLSGLALSDGGPHPAPLRQQPYTAAASQQWVANLIADPGPVNNGVYALTNVRSVENAAVQGASTANGADVTHVAPQGATSEQWRLQSRPGGYWWIVNVNSGKCLRLETADANPGTRLEQWTCDTSNRQQWTLRRHADTRYGLVSRQSGLAVALTGGAQSALEQQPYRGGENAERVWALRPVN